MDDEKSQPSNAPAPEPFAVRRLGMLGLFLAVFFFYMLSTSREDTWGDARPIYDVAENLLAHGKIDIPTRWPETLPLGRNGKVYAVAPLLQSMMQMPAVAIRALTTWLFPKSVHLSKQFLCHLAPAALGALTCVLFFGICRRLRLSRPAALLGTGALALCTTVWVYSRTPYAEMLQTACFTGFFASLLNAVESPTRRNALWLGAWAGLVVNSKIIYLGAVAGGGLWLLWSLRRERRALVAVVGWAIAALVPFLGLIALYNYLRWGSPLSTGYSTRSAELGENPIFGLWGLFLSPGKSVFLYSPPLLLSLLALRRCLQRCPRLLWAIVATAGPVALFTATLLYWSGDYAWGPRYLVAVVPVLLLPGCYLIDDLVAIPPGRRRRLAGAALGLLLAAGAAVQVLGNAFHWDHFIRIQREARNNWLGHPNTTGSPFHGLFRDVCGACFEDMHGMTWLPPFQPIEGHYWLLKHVPFGHDWVRAEKDAPWHRDTNLQVNIATMYPRARIDWWFLDYGRDHLAVGIGLMLALAAGLAGGVMLMVRRLLR